MKLLNQKSKIMELVKVKESPIIREVVDQEVSSDQFILSNTLPLSYEQLRNECIIPVFAKDNESTISNPEFILAVYEAAQKWFNGERLLKPAVRVSHPIKGRIPEAMGKSVELLSDNEKTIYYERMAFVVEIPSIRDTVNGNDLSLTVGGVRAYNLENLYRGKSEERFKVFIGFKNAVCINLCISTDGFKAELKVRTIHELANKAYELFSNFNAVRQIEQLNRLDNYSITENQFAQLIGRARLFHYLPSKDKKDIPEVPVSDSQISIVAKDYYSSESFCKNDNGDIDLWKLYNLFTGANKSSYIDTFLDRGAGSHTFIKNIQEALETSSKHWFLS
jgi:hypothetical protein